MSPFYKSRHKTDENTEGEITKAKKGYFSHDLSGGILTKQEKNQRPIYPEITLLGVNSPCQDSRHCDRASSIYSGKLEASPGPLAGRGLDPEQALMCDSPSRPGLGLHGRAVDRSRRSQGVSGG